MNECMTALEASHDPRMLVMLPLSNLIDSL